MSNKNKKKRKSIIVEMRSTGILPNGKRWHISFTMVSIFKKSGLSKIAISAFLTLQRWQKQVFVKKYKKLALI